MTHNGSSNFIVHSYQGGKEDFLVNEIGSYRGSRPLFSEAPIFFDIDADGAWSLTIEPIGLQTSSAFSGVGDSVSDLFLPDSSSPAPWLITHDGQSNFIVHLYCAGGEDFIENEIGPVNASKIVSFSKGPCLWEVQADGNWSLKPR